LTARVREAIEVLGYIPHQGARGLRVGHNHIIGMVIRDVTNPFYVGVLRAVERAARNSGYDVVICDSDDQIDIERSHLSALHARRRCAVPCPLFLWTAFLGAQR
jgi:DNA-binding LacI/PurR family transcriptional regulator